MLLTSAFLASACDAVVSGPLQTFDGVVTDSRKPCAGALFVALRGENFDGHDYVADAIAAGATGVLASQPIKTPKNVALFIVEDTLVALQRMAKAHRARFTGSVVAITGSNGKTSTKQMTASVLCAHFGEDAVLSTVGSLNNHIGVPLTLLRLTETHRVAVVEMGMNHFDELSLLTALATPDIAAITNAGPAHLEGVGSLMGVAKAKGEIFEGLKPDGVAVINADDEFAAYWRVVARNFKQTLFGFSLNATMRGEITQADSFAIHYSADSQPMTVSMALPGRHNQMNALAVASIAKALNVSTASLKLGLESATNVAGRLTQYKLGQRVTLIDDSYNANPASMRAAAAILCAATPPRILVLGDMAELGDGAINLHRELASFFASQPIDHIFTHGAQFGAVNAAFAGKAKHFDQINDLNDAALRACAGGATLLAKGANSMRMGRVIAYLKEKLKETA